MLMGLLRILDHAIYSAYRNVKGTVKNISSCYLYSSRHTRMLKGLLRILAHAIYTAVSIQEC